jgi:hypothetical protein
VDRGLERVGTHSLLLVDRDRPHGARAEAEHVGRAADHDVCLLGCVQGDRPVLAYALLAHLDPERHIARALERDEVRHRAAGHDHAAGTVGQAEALRQPAGQMQLDLRCPRAEPVAAEVRVQPRGEQLRRRPRDSAGADDVGEEPRMAHQQRLVERQLAQVRDELGDRQRLLGHR